MSFYYHTMELGIWKESDSGESCAMEVVITSIDAVLHSYDSEEIVSAGITLEIKDASGNLIDCTMIRENFE